MANFFAELKRRHIYRVGAAYVVVAWAMTQVIDVLSQVFRFGARGSILLASANLDTPTEANTSGVRCLTLTMPSVFVTVCVARCRERPKCIALSLI